MERFEFQVVSASSGEVYHLQAYRTETGVRFTCTCPAGENGMHCRHRVGLLTGDMTGLLDPDPERVGALVALVGASPIATALARVATAEQVVAQAQRELKSTKKLLARTMMG